MDLRGSELNPQTVVRGRVITFEIADTLAVVTGRQSPVGISSDG
jgi:hypothetical protein